MQCHGADGMIQHTVYKPSVVKTERGLLTIIPLPELLSYLGVV